MELLRKLEKTILGWIKGIPHLPPVVQKWLGDNIWWIVLIVAILSGISVLFTFIGLMAILSSFGTIAASYYVTSTFTTWALVTGFVGLTFLAIETALLAFAVKPLKEKQKKGWVLLFISWLINIISIVVSTILTFNPLSFIVGLLFGAIGVAITGYFLFEIHGQFAHVERSKGVRGAKTTK